MKIKRSLFLLMLSLIVFKVNGFGNHQKTLITLDVKDVHLTEVLEELQIQSGFNFIFNEKIKNNLGNISINVVDIPIEDVMEQILKEKNLKFDIRENIIVITEKQPSNQQDFKVIKIEGMVQDINKNPIPGVSILLKGTNLGTSTDKDGKFSFNIPSQENVILIFTFIGMQSKEYKYKNEKYITIILEEDIQNIEEVVITGYQRIRKSEMVGSSNTISRDDLFYDGTGSIEQMLQGKLPGTVVINTDGLVGSRQKVRVRGTSTLLSSQEPVWVVDGIIQEDPIPFKTQDLGNMGDNFDMIRNFIGNNIAWLNPNDIEDITVLKDAAATVMYGVKAANGVIVINTKRGKEGSMAVNYSGNFSFTEKLNYKKMNLMNSKERIDVSREIYKRKLIGSAATGVYVGYEYYLNEYLNKRISFQEFNNEIKRIETVNTDWIDILYRTPFSNSHSLSLSGGVEKIRYYASLSYNETYGTAKGNDSKNYGGSINLTAYLNKKINVDVRLSGNIANTKAFYQVDPYNYALETSRAIPAFNEDGSRHFYTTIGHNDVYYLFNIQNEIDETGNTNDKRTLNTSIVFNYDIFPKFRFESSFGLGSTNTVGESYASEFSHYITTKRYYNFEEFGVGDELYEKSPLPHGGEFNSVESRNTSLTWRNSLNYSKNINKHGLTIYLGQEIRSIKYKELTSTVYGYFPDKGKVITYPPLNILNYGTVYIENKLYKDMGTKITDSKSNYVSYYGSFIYSFDNRYVLSASFRSDASNRFGQDKRHKYLPVWSIGGRWNAHNELLMRSQSVISELNFRASYGWQGNVAENFGPDLIAYIPNPILNQYMGEYQLRIRSLGYADLRWEKTKTISLGIDLGLAQNRLTATFEYYHKKTEDMIIYKEVPLSYGIEQMPINGGNMLNRGIEFTVNGTILRSNDFVWSLSLNSSKNFNRLKSDILSAADWRNAVGGELSKKGYPVTSFWAFELKGLDPIHGYPLYDIPSPVENPDSQYDATEYMKYMGKLEPDFTGGISTVFRYKTFTLSGTFNLSIGGKKFLYEIFQSGGDLPSAYENLPQEFTKRWKKPGDEKNTNIPSIPFYDLTNTGMYYFKGIYLPNDTGNIVSLYELYNYTDARVVNSSFFRCNNLALTYYFTDKFLNQVNLSNISVTASVTNPFIIMSKNFKGVDPEVNTGKQPITKTFSLGLNLSF